MKTVTQKAWGKLNLTLDVLGKRPDGYHEMQMIMQSVDLCDDVTVSVTEQGGWVCTCDAGDVPAGLDNLALKAASVFCRHLGVHPEGLFVSIVKRIPMQGGMAGGSADAAAVFHALNEIYGMPLSVEQLMQMAQSLGSDVPYCILGGTALAEGRGELLSRLPDMPKCAYVLVRPRFSVSTPALFRQLDENVIPHHPDTNRAVSFLQKGDLPGFCSCMYNVFQPILAEQYPVIDDICRELNLYGSLASCLTGTGSVVFGVFAHRAQAALAAEKLRDRYTVFVVENV